MTDLSYIAPPVDRELIKKELKQKHFLRMTNRGNKEIYITTAHLSPNIMREIGRLRELSFATDGGGTGKEVDIDEYDTLPDPYCCKQLFVWNTEDEEIVGGYRFAHGSTMLQRPDGTIATPTAEHYQFSQEFLDNYLPYTVELGRAFVQPAYQPSFNLGKGLYSLDNLWDGLGALVLEIPETRYFLGKITIYDSMDLEARDLILFFYQKYFPDPDGLMWPYEPTRIETDYNRLVKLFNGRNYKEDYQILLHAMRARGCTVPALVNAYMNLSSTMRYFGTCPDHGLPGTNGIGILITLKDINADKRQRHVDSYSVKNAKFDRKRLFRINMKRLPWWRKTSDEENETLLELSLLKNQQLQREEEKEREYDKKVRMNSLKHSRRKFNKDDNDD
ncbi:MAG: GNAT family N-acetyltransferase [Bacteroidales bacterium]|nr:GNAT family N-acetyltransferase [Bacteroidales bacterium]